MKKLAERTLYHGTVRDHRDSIEKYGLIPGVGNLTSMAYGEYEDYTDGLPELVFAADKKGLNGAVSAMAFAVGEKVGKSAYEVVRNHDDIARHGMLVILKDREGEFIHRRREEDPEFDFLEDEGHPMTVEPGDWYSEDGVEVDMVLTGRKLVSFLKQRGALKDEPRTRLVRTLIRKHGDESRPEISKYVNQISPETADRIASRESADRGELIEFIKLTLESPESQRAMASSLSNTPAFGVDVGDSLGHRGDSENKRYQREKLSNAIQKGRMIKQAYAKHADRQFLDTLKTIHWGEKRGVLSLIMSASNRRNEISCAAYLPNDAVIPNSQVGLLIKGHISLLANTMDDVFSLSGQDYERMFPERTRDSGTNKGVAAGVTPHYIRRQAERRPVLVLDEEDWDPIYHGGPYNEALVDNWIPLAVVCVADREMFRKILKSEGIDLPVLDFTEV